MQTAIQVKVSPAYVRTYQNLLREDWSEATLEEVLLLLRKLIVQDLAPEEHSWQNIYFLSETKKAATQFDQVIISRIRDLATAFREPSIPRMPAHFNSNRPSRSATLAEETWAYLVLQAMAELDDKTGLFADAQSLLFLCAAHFLLPQLKDQGLRVECASLANAMYIHTVLVWRADPSHSLHLQSVLMDQLGDRERRLELLEQSFRATSPDDHSYLTKATAYWSDLMDLRQFEHAGEFLLSLTRAAPRECQDEIREMFRELIASTSRVEVK